MIATDDTFGCANEVQNFLICTTIHKAKQTTVTNGYSFLRVTFNRQSKQTKPQKDNESPFINENFVFEVTCSLVELLRQTILYELKRKTAYKKVETVSQILVDMQSVWNQPGRSFFQKWGRFEVPIGVQQKVDPRSHCLGYLQLDLAIVTQVADQDDTVFFLPSLNDDDEFDPDHDPDNVEENLLQDLNKGHAHCNVKYLFHLYNGIFMKKGDYIIQVSFGGYHGKTNVARNTSRPMWNQEIEFVWAFPSLSQTFLIELLTHDSCRWRAIAEYELHFDEISFMGRLTRYMFFLLLSLTMPIFNVDKPSIGPTYIHLYNPYNTLEYLGRIMIELRSECIGPGLTREINIQPTDPVNSQWVLNENWHAELVFLGGYFLHGQAQSAKFGFKMAEWHTRNIEISSRPVMSQLKHCQPLTYFIGCRPFRSTSMKATFPNYLEKYNADFFIQEIIETLHMKLAAFRSYQFDFTNDVSVQSQGLITVCESLNENIVSSINQGRLQYGPSAQKTQWDENRYEFISDYFKKLSERIVRNVEQLQTTLIEYMSEAIEEVVLDMNRLLADLNGLLQTIRIQDDWPDLNLILSINNKDIGLCRVNPKYFLDMLTPCDRQRKMNCWKGRCFIFKNIKCPHSCFNCGCIVGILYGCLGIVNDMAYDRNKCGFSKDWKVCDPAEWMPVDIQRYYTCRIFIHQAKIRPTTEITNACDTFVRVVFFDSASETEIVFEKLAPIWNVVVVMANLQLPGSYQWFEENPPLVAVELYNINRAVSSHYVGCGLCPVTVNLTNTFPAFNNKNMPIHPPYLNWVPVSQNGSVRAEVLISAQLVEFNPCDDDIDGESVRPVVTQVSGLPAVIKPVMHNYVMETVFVGFRRYRTASERHSVKVMMGELILKSGMTKASFKESMNFYLMYACGVVSLPHQTYYWPSIIVTDFTELSSGNEKTHGAAIINDSKRFINIARKIKCNPPAKPYDICYVEETSHSIPMEENEDPEPFWVRVMKYRIPNIIKVSWHLFINVVLSRPRATPTCEKRIYPLMKDIEYSWWAKYYHSINLDRYHCYKYTKQRLTIYHQELEKQPEFSHFQDWATPVRLVRGVKHKKNMGPMEESYAILKMRIKLTRCYCDTINADDPSLLKPITGVLNPRYQQEIQQLGELRKLLVRVYVVQCHNVICNDPFVKCRLGGKVVSQGAKYIPSKNNPVFGVCLQLEAIIPREHILEISVVDRKKCTDDLVGSTTIDIEDRWYTKHRARVGINREFSRCGYNMWRDALKPVEILRQLCEQHKVEAPTIKDNIMTIDAIKISDHTIIEIDEDPRERLSLTALRNLTSFPSFGFSLVPEHVETRTLYNSECPGIPQGKILLWVELFEANMQIPPPIDISPVKIREYELRCVIFRIKDAKLKTDNILNSTKSDLLVKGWLALPEEAQSTDRHFNATNGEASFNWRFIFPLYYGIQEDMIVVRRYDHTGVCEFKVPPIFSIGLVDNSSPDEFVGKLDFNLSNLAEPFEKDKDVIPYDEMLEKRQTLNLFAVKVVKGWFPLHEPEPQNEIPEKFPPMKAKVEVMLSIHSLSEAKRCSAGLGREAPSKLPLPNRGETSLDSLLNPLRGLFKFLLVPLTKFALVATIAVLAVWGILFFLSCLPSPIPFDD